VYYTTKRGGLRTEFGSQESVAGIRARTKESASV
jgi:hypothetical protein